MVSRHFRKQPDESDTEPAVKPMREAPGRRPKERRSLNPLRRNRSRSKSRERKDKTTSKIANDVKDAKIVPLLAEKVSTARRTRRDIPAGERRVRAALASPPNSPARRSPYAPPPPPSPSPSPVLSYGDKYIEDIPSDDAATASSSVCLSPRSQAAVDAVLNPRLSVMTSYTTDGSSYTDGSALNTTFTDTETGMSSTFGTTYEEDDDENELQTLATGFTDEYDELREIGAQYKSQSTEEGGWSVDQSHVPLQQNVAGMSIFISTVQLALVLIQLCLCGVASIDVNPMLGPFPDAFSEWGGKNAYLMLDDRQYFRFLTPIFLHVGIVHLLSNAFCQLQICALFERQWGTGTWLSAYLIGGIGAVATSCVMNPDEIGVSSSGALMGLFGAKIAQIVTYHLFDLDSKAYLKEVRVDDLGGVLCGAAVTFLFTFLTYIDLSGHLGGLLSGFLAGILLFCSSIESGCLRFLWASLGLGGIIGGGASLCYVLWVEIYPDDELADACQYFRSLYPEGYECECQWA